MKRIVFCLYFIIASTVLFGQDWEQMKLQGITSSHNSSSVNRMLSSSYRRFVDVDDLRAQGNNLSRNAIVAQYNDSLFFLLYKYKNRYLGKLKQRKDGSIQIERNKWGIERTMPYDHGDTFEYYIGEWKNNFRHRKGYYVNANGKVVAGTWENGYLKPKSVRKEVPQEEQMYIQDLIKKINELTIK